MLKMSYFSPQVGGHGAPAVVRVCSGLFQEPCNKNPLKGAGGCLIANLSSLVSEEKCFSFLVPH